MSRFKIPAGSDIASKLIAHANDHGLTWGEQGSRYKDPGNCGSLVREVEKLLALDESVTDPDAIEKTIMNYAPALITPKTINGVGRLAKYAVNAAKQKHVFEDPPGRGKDEGEGPREGGDRMGGGAQGDDQGDGGDGNGSGDGQREGSGDKEGAQGDEQEGQQQGDGQQQGQQDPEPERPQDHPEIPDSDLWPLVKKRMERGSYGEEDPYPNNEDGEPAPVKRFFDGNKRMRNQMKGLAYFQRRILWGEEFQGFWNLLDWNTFELWARIVSGVRNIYAWGEPGAGKTHGALAVAEALGYNVTIVPSPRDVWTDVLGYKTPDGKYVATPFVEAYSSMENTILIIEEMDRSVPDVQVQLNTALANDVIATPGGEFQRGPNVVVVATGNTIGKGANDLITTAQELDDSTMSRFSFIHIDYDPAVEEWIAGDDGADILEFCRDLRQALKDSGVRFTLGTYRHIEAMTRFKKLAALGYTDEEMLEQTMGGMTSDKDTLATVYDRMKHKGNRFTVVIGKMAGVQA